MRFFSPPENPALSAPAHHGVVDLQVRQPGVHDLLELESVELRWLTLGLAHGVHGVFQKADGRHSGNLHRILEGEEDSGLGPSPRAPSPGGPPPCREPGLAVTS